MAKGAYIGVNGVAQKIKKGYIGVEGAARKIKKGYIGVGGVARPCWSGGELEYFGDVTLPYVTLMNRIYADGNIGNWLLLCTGIYGNVTPYDTNLTRGTSIGANSSGYLGVGEASSKHYAAFASGYYESDTSSRSNAAEFYNSSLTKTSSTLPDARFLVSGASVGDYIIFAGGYTTNPECNGYAYNDSLVKTSVFISTYRNPGSAQNSNYAVFAGGWSGISTSAASSKVTAFNSNLVKTSPTDMPHACIPYGGNVNEYLVFATSGTSGATYVYDENLTLLTPITATANLLGNLASTTIGILRPTKTVIDVINPDLTITQKPYEWNVDTSYWMSTGTIGNKAVIYQWYSKNNTYGLHGYTF